MQNPFFLRLAVAFLALTSIAARAVAPTPIVLTNSVKRVEAQAAISGPSHPFISHSSLTAEQSAAPMKFDVALKMRNLAELQARVARGERISAKELAEKYEPLASDYQAVVDWANSNGLTIEREDNRHMLLFLSGQVSHVGKALQVDFARVTAGGKEYTSAISAPSVPAEISAHLLGINGLQPHLRRHKHLVHRSQASPDALGGGVTYYPAQIATAYKAKGLYDTDITGSGQTIAIVIDTFPATNDLLLFWQAAGINQSLNNIQFIQVVDGQLPDPSGEETLDVQWSSAMAPGAKIRVYAATDLTDEDLDASYQAVLDDVTNHPELNIHQMSMSFGEGETSITDSQLDTDAGLFAELASQGVTCFASAGDDGSTPNDSANGGTNGPLQVDNPASDPSVTGVGGTTLKLDASNNLLTETVWNEGSNGGITGGGVSIHFARPSWQTGTGVDTSGMREVPDIALTADPDFGALTYFQGEKQVVGGTSWSSPSCAGFCALINQARASAGLGTVGILGPSVYPKIGTANLHDITSGNNATSRSAGKYVATVGYDECTGVGSPFVLPLAQAIAGTTTLIGLNEPAASQTVFPGQNASFTVTAGGGSPTYQWQRMPIGSSSWSNLGDDSTYSGTTATKLTITATTTAMSGDEFRCLVHVTTGTMTTTTSVLIVDQPLVVSTLAGSAETAGLANGTGTAAKFDYPSGIALDSSGNLYVADFANNQIRKVTPAGKVTTPFGSTSGLSGTSNGNGNSALFNNPNAIAVDSSGNFYVADSGNNSIRKITGNAVTTLAGASNGFSGPQGVAVDSSGNVYVADTGNDTIRKITPGGTVSVFAGQTGNAGFANGNATSTALFNAPEAVACDSSGNVYVADFGNDVIRKISGGTVTTLAGKAGQGGYADGLAANALFNAPTGLGFDSSGNLYITDSLVPSPTSDAAGNCVVRKLTPAGVVSTVAGSAGTNGSTDGTGTAAEFFSVQAVACDPSGLVYLADTYNQTVRIATVSGTPTLTHATVSLSNLVTTYNGSPQAVTAATNPSGLDVVITYNGTTTTPPTSVGTYSVSATISDPDYTGHATGTLIINKAVAAVTVGNLAATYTGSSHTATATTTPSGLGVSLTYNGSTTPPTAVGSYFVLATVSDPNYGGTGTGTLVISKAAATVTLGSLADTYTGAAQAATATTNPAGLPVTFTYNGKTTLPVTAGSYAVVGTVNTANAAGSSTGTLVISPATATVTLGNLTAVYTGKPITATATTVPAKIAVSFTYTGTSSSTTAPTLVGSYPVTGTISNPNYTGHATSTLVITPVLPLAVTAAATSVGANTATLNSTITSKGASTSVVYQYGTTTAYGSTTGSQIVAAGTTTAAAPKSISGLQPQTLYHFRVVATNGAGPVNGADKTFTTLAQPVFGSSPATPLLSASGAQVGFSVNPEGVSTSVYFQFGTTTSYGSQTTTQAIGAGKAAVNVTVFLGPLEPNTTYHYRLVTVSAAGTFLGPDETFATLGFDTTLVAASGDSAADIASATFNTFGNPAVNEHDAVAFSATLIGATTTTNLGIFADNSGGTRHALAQIGIVGGAPLASGSGTFIALGSPVYNNNEDVAFSGTLKVATGVVTTTTDLGVWSTSSGSLALVARQGSQAPDCAAGVTFSAFNSVGLSDAGTVIQATLTSSTVLGVTAANNFGIWEGTTTNDLALILRTGDTVGGKTLSKLTLFSTQAAVGGQTRNFASDTGDLVAGATFTDKTTGIVDVVGGTPSLVAIKGDTAAGTGGAAYSVFSMPIINTNDRTAFEATLATATGLVTTTTNAGIWADNNAGTRQLIARTGNLAPGTTADFVTLNDPVYNNNEAVAFSGTLKVTTGQATTTTATGIWCNSAGSLELIARQGGQAPGCLTGATFATFTALALADQGGSTNKGGVIFLGTLNANTAAAVATTNNTGIWAVDNTGTLQLIVRTGDLLNNKIVTALTFLPPATTLDSQSRSFAQENGDLVYLATFSDKTTAIFNVVFP